MRPLLSAFSLSASRSCCWGSAPAGHERPLPGANGKIAYVRIVYDPYSVNIYTMNPDGSEQTDPTPDGFFNVGPSWSPDGRQITYMSDRGGGVHGFALIEMNADGSGKHTLLADGVRSPASWSPDGKWLVFSGDDVTTYDEEYNIFKARSDGSGLTRLTNTPIPDGVDLYPAWSPTGDTIAYTTSSASTPYWTIRVMNSDGTNQHTLMAAGGNDLYPDWSPDGFESGIYALGSALGC